MNFAASDQEHQGRSAFKVMIAYERWLQSGGPERQRELAVLRMTGLFDQPMAKSCLQALRAEPSIPGLTDALVTLTPQQWNIAVKRLSDVELLSVSTDAIDAHPLIREYFALQLQRDQPEAFRAAHSRLFDDLCENTPYRPDGLDGLAPLYEAVTHGCLAGRHQEACEKVYVDRINRGTGSDGFYSSKKLGAIGADLAAVAAFFLPSSSGPWSQVSPNLTAADQAWLLNEAAFRLRALGRLTEALQPMRAGFEMRVQQKHWREAAACASNLSELEVTLGRLTDAVTGARQSITHADQSGDAIQRFSTRETAADALHQSGQRAEAGVLFAEAERLQQERQPQFNLLYSLGGFRYCDWLLAPVEQAAWQHLLALLGCTTDFQSVALIDGQDVRRTERLDSSQTKVAIIAPRDEPSSQRPHLPTEIATCSNSNLEGTSRGALTDTLPETTAAIIAPREEPSSQRPHLPTEIATCSNSNLEGTSRGAMTATLTEAKSDSSATGLEFEESNSEISDGKSLTSEALAEIERRASRYFAQEWNWYSLLDIALDHLTLARVGLIRAILEAGSRCGIGIRPVGIDRREGNNSDRLEASPTQPTLDLPHVAAAVNGLRGAGSMNHLPRGLLTAALYHFVRGEPALAEKHLAEAQQIAERGPMPLFLADIHLTRARLFRDRAALTEAATLIRELGYGRRYEELEDAEKALG